MDGRRGLVPSNLVSRLVGEDLLDFHQSLICGLRDSDESMSTSVPQDLDFGNSSDELAAGKSSCRRVSLYHYFSCIVSVPILLQCERLTFRDG